MALKLVKNRKVKDGPWYVRGSVRGRRVEESTGTRERKRAEEYRARREAEILDEAIHGRSAVATFASAALSYMEQGGERRFMSPLLSYFGTRKLSEIDQVAVETCAKALMPTAKPSTINRQIFTPVSAVLQHAANRKMCAEVSLERPRQPEGKTRWLSVEEAQALINASGPHLRPLITFLIYTGSRISEALFLDWKQVDLSRAHVQFLKTKNGEPRGMPLHPSAVAALANLPDREGAVFRKPSGLPYQEKDEGGGMIKTAFRIAAFNAGLGSRKRGANGRWIYSAEVTPHTLRHTWASWYYLEHRDLLALMKLGGWKTMTMVQRYAHLNSSNFAPAINALPIISGEIWGKCGNAVQPSSGNDIVLKRIKMVSK
jgi:integrase